jgi:transposase
MSQRIDISLEGLQQLLDRIERQQLEPQDWPLVSALVLSLFQREKGKVERLLAQLLAQQAAAGASPTSGSPAPDGAGTSAASQQPEPGESSKGPHQGESLANDPPPAPSSGADAGAKTPQGHGRNGAQAFTGAKNFFYKLAQGIVGSLCEACKKGRLKRYRDKVIIRVVGQPIFGAEIHRAERARCLVCGKVITASTMPSGLEDGIGKHVIYHWKACAMLLVLHYTSGQPFKRIESLHQGWGIPFSDANQWEVVSQSIGYLLPLVNTLEQHGVQRGLNLRIDDTGSMVVELQRQIVAECDAAKALGLSLDEIRTGINATCARLETPEGTVILFFTGRHHAGEMIEQLLKHRSVNSGKIVKITDGASKNFDHGQEDKVIEAVCNAHAFLKFHDVKEQFPAEYALVGEAYHHVFKNDALTRERKMSPDERLAYHQKHSLPWMEKIKQLCSEKIENRLLEPRSPLWKPVHFVINQWQRLTKFLEVPGVPLDTNLVEQELITAVRYLAASFNYQTSNGSKAGDAAMSLIATARANDVEPVAYLAYCLENHADLEQHPEKYLPWVYRETVQARARDKPAHAASG